MPERHRRGQRELLAPVPLPPRCAAEGSDSKPRAREGTEPHATVTRAVSPLGHWNDKKVLVGEKRTHEGHGSERSEAAVDRAKCRVVRAPILGRHHGVLRSNALQNEEVAASSYP